ncbi:MAG: ribonuclease PH [Polyangiales bacterium]
MTAGLIPARNAISFTTRPDGRAPDALRNPHIEVGFHRRSEGSVLYRAGGTVILSTASIETKVPSFLEGKGKGWVTAEYQMHPRANLRREGREGRSSKGIGGRTHEIQRLIGRSLRAAIDLERLGERQIVVDCDVLEADGGTRTASITSGFIALAIALHRLFEQGTLTVPVLRAPVAAISVGHLDEMLALDLVYQEDSRARVDLNMVATEAGDIIEVQGTAEGAPIPRSDLDAMINLSLKGIHSLCALQRKTLQTAEIDLSQLLIPRATTGGSGPGVAESDVTIPDTDLRAR